MSVPTVPLGSQGLRVSAQGLGCMGMSAFYGPGDEQESLATLDRALELGVTFWDTAELYGQGANEELIGRALAGRRDRVVLATKFGIVPDPENPGRRMHDGSPANVRRSIEGSLRRLGTDHVDLYYQHRPDPKVPVEDTVGALAQLVAEGKVLHLGLSEVDADVVERAHAVHPLTAVQSEYSLWTRDAEQLLPTLRRLGIGLVAYSPLGRGFLTGRFTSPADFTDDDFRSVNPRFAQEAFDANMRIVDVVKQVAAARGATPAQVALAWVASRGESAGGQGGRLDVGGQGGRLDVGGQGGTMDIVSIPGTRRPDRLEENVGALDVTLTGDDLARLEPLGELVVGARY